MLPDWSQAADYQGRVYIIAEAGINHNGDLERALNMVDVAAEAGVDAIKFQAFQAEALVQPNAEKASYQKERTNTEESQLEMLRQYELTPTEFCEVANRAVARGIDFICTPFDYQSVDMLEHLPISAIKIASGEITNHPLLRYAASKGKPLILSTGMATLGEIEAALEVVRATGCQKMVLLHCTSSYPVPDDEVNLRVINSLATVFGLPVGFSDHTLGTDVAVAAVALGAVIIEKHFTLDKALPGPDHAMSLDPEELRRLVCAIRRVEKALGSPIKRVTPTEEEVKRAVRRSICAARDIKCGEQITEGMITCKRPGTGIPPTMVGLVVGRKARRDIKSGDQLSWGDVM